MDCENSKGRTMLDAIGTGEDRWLRFPFNIVARAQDRSCAGFQTPGCRPIHARRRQASEKRQGTKSREVERRRCSGGYGDLAAAGMVGIVDCSGRSNPFRLVQLSPIALRAVRLVQSCCLAVAA